MQAKRRLFGIQRVSYLHNVQKEFVEQTVKTKFNKPEIPKEISNYIREYPQNYIELKFDEMKMQDKIKSYTTDTPSTEIDTYTIDDMTVCVSIEFDHGKHTIRYVMLDISKKLITYEYDYYFA